MKTAGKRTVRTLLLFAMACACSLGSNPAARAEDPVELQIITDVVQGQGDVGLKLLAHEYVENATLKVNGKTYRVKDIEAGTEKLIAIAQKPGTVQYRGRLSVDFGGGQEGGMPIEFALTVLAPLKLAVPPDSFNAAEKKLTLKADRPLSKVEYTVVADTGDILDEGVMDIRKDAFNRTIYLKWAGREGTIIRIDIKAWDTSGAFSQMELSPWHVDVEHEEVNFPSGSAAITEEEKPKLDAAYEHIKEKVATYGKLVKLNLYIVGYTDTVGKKDYNLDLSMRRARSIAAYFRHKGFTFPIYYQGFGEEVLAAPTADETDEARNRRALYLLGGDYRPTGRDIPRPDWKPLN